MKPHALRSPATETPNAPQSRQTTAVVSLRREPRFLDDTTVGSWTREGVATLRGSILTLHRPGERLMLQDALRVLGPGRGVDVVGLSGRVFTLREFVELGGTLSREAARLNGVEYHIQLGYLAIALPQAIAA